MSEPVTWKVWSEHLDESDAGEVIADNAFGALLFFVSALADDREADPGQPYLGEFPGELWFVKGPSGGVATFKQTAELCTIFERVIA